MSLCVADSDVDSSVLKLTLCQKRLKLIAFNNGEAPFGGRNDNLSSWVLHAGTSEGLNGNLRLFGTAPNRHEDLSDLDTSCNTSGLSESTTHTSLESISSST